MALVHDYLTQFGGAERVLMALHALFPQAPVFTSLVDFEHLPESTRTWDLRSSPLQRIPGAARRHHLLLPLYPHAFASFQDELAGYDLVIADSSAWSHHAPVADDALLVCYCHSPARFLHADPSYLEPSGLSPLMQSLTAPMFIRLRRQDRRAVQRVNRFVANSHNVANRIRRIYGRHAAVVYPPVDVERYLPVTDVPSDGYYLVVSRLVPHKRVELAIQACSLAKRPLRIIGDGRSRAGLEAIAGSNVTFEGHLPDDQVREALRHCRALIVPAEEDFGLVMVEAQAAGRPVIAFGRGGALESIVQGRTGILFAPQSSEALATAITELEITNWSAIKIHQHARAFDTAQFRAGMVNQLLAALSQPGGHL